MPTVGRGLDGSDCAYAPSVSCILCAIADGAAPAEVHYSEEEVVAITPLRTMAPIHVLLFPRLHFPDLPALLRSDAGLVALLMSFAGRLAEERGLDERGYRLAWNHGPDTNQTILHPHLHLLGGRPLQDALA